MVSNAAAPGRLELVRRFVNSRDIEADKEDLDSPQALGAWLHAEGLLERAGSVTPAHHRAAIALREAFRAALAANHDLGPIPDEALAVLNTALAQAKFDLRVDASHRLGMEPTGPGVSGALGALLVIMNDASADGTWRRLKVCANDGCQWAFYDRSRARSGTWCSMGLCGNRSKQRAWRQRATADARPS